MKQASFQAHFEDKKHQGMSDCEITLINQTDSADYVRTRKSFWQSELDNFQPIGLKEPDVAHF